MSASGKEVLLNIILELSTQITKKQDIDIATKKIKAGLLLHGSTSEENFDLVDRVKWSSDEENGQVWRQGLALSEKNIFISDFFETLWLNENIQKQMISEYDSLTSEEYESCMFTIWLLISATQMFEQTLSVENKGAIDINSWTQKAINKLEAHKARRVDK